MRQLGELTRALIGLNLFVAENIESVADEPKIIPSGKEATLDTGVNEPGVILYRQTYTGVFNINNYPFKRNPVELLLGYVSAYLLENGNGDYQIPQPEINIDVLDHYMADIEIQIKFVEDVYGVEDPDGLIPLNGKTYRIADPVIDYVLSGDVAA